MRAFTIRQPFCYLAAAGDPRVGSPDVKGAEFRSFGAGVSVGERVALHAASQPHRLAGEVARLLGSLTPDIRWAHLLSARQAVIATARVARIERAFASRDSARLCVSARLTDDEAAAALRLFDWSGLWAWHLDEVVALGSPVFCGGALGLWELRAETAHQVRALEAAGAEGRGLASVRPWVPAPDLPAVPEPARAAAVARLDHVRTTTATTVSLPRQGDLFRMGGR